MPLATGITEALAKASLAEKVEAVRQIAATLAGLLERGISHRDVKPENLYQHRGRFVVGDFGLARRPEDPSLTGDKPVGPWAHLPSEVFMRPGEPGQELDWEKVDVHCLANTLWRLVTGADTPPRGPILAQGNYALTRHTEESYVSELDLLIEKATSDAPENRPKLEALERQLSHWLEASQIRDEILREDERLRRNKATVLRWLVNHVREEPVFRRLRWDIEDPTAPSGIDDLTEGEVREALDELWARGLITGDKKEALGGAVIWTHLFPTVTGAWEVEDHHVLMAQMTPLLRALMTKIDYVQLMPDEDLQIGTLRIPPPEAFFQLIHLGQRGYISFRDERENGGGGVSFLDVAITPHGRDWLVATLRSANEAAETGE
jgi:hypothetical protein